MNKLDVSDINLKREQHRKAILLASLLIALISLLCLFAPANASSETTKAAINFVMGLIAQVLVWILQMLGVLLLLLVDILISVVQYNTFVHATPVNIGWPLIRDTVNMFFIIVVLVSAFSTIVGYQDFRYNKVLPKLLLMAVLINFSKTLIGLMIDFSQVVVLTFVNGFKQAAGGNFVQALQIGKIMRLNEGGAVIKEEGGQIVVDNSWAAAQQSSAWSMMNILLAAIFGIFIVAISITLILIMIIFFVARIILLWFLLITSPVMFFAWALPDKMKKAFSAFTEDWWSRLSTALIGGPTMAFFLWLSLAMAAKQGDLIGSGGLYDPKQVSAEVTSAQTAVGAATQNSNIAATKIGQPDIFATFLIMVIFMLVGVEASVRFSKTLSPQLGSFAEKIKGKGGVGGVTLPASWALGAGRVAARTTAKGIRGGYGAGRWAVGKANKYVDIEGMAGRGIMAVAPTAGLKRVGAKMAGAKAREAVKEAGELEKDIAGLSYKDKMAVIDRQAAALTGTKAQKQGAQLAKAKLLTNSDYYKSEVKDEMDRLKAQGMDEDQAHVQATATVNSRLSGQLEKAEADARRNDDQETLKKIKETYEKLPSLKPQGDKVMRQAKEDAAHMEVEKKLDPKAFQNAQYALSYYKAKGWIDENGEETVEGRTSEERKNHTKGVQGKYYQAHLAYAQGDGKAVVKDIIAGKEGQNYTVGVSKDGKSFIAADVQGRSASGRFDKSTDDPKTITRNMTAGDQASLNLAMNNMGQVRDADSGAARAVQTADIGTEMNSTVATRFTAAAQTMGSMATPAQKATQRAKMGEEFLQHGVSPRAIFGYDSKSGRFGSTDGNQGHKQMLSNLASKLQTNTASSEDVKTFATALSQAGSSGEAFENVAEMVRSSNQAALVRALEKAEPEQQKQIRTALLKVVNQAEKDIASGATGTSFQQAREMIRQEDPANVKTSRRLRTLLK